MGLLDLPLFVLYVTLMMKNLLIRTFFLHSYDRFFICFANRTRWIFRSNAQTKESSCSGSIGRSTRIHRSTKSSNLGTETFELVCLPFAVLLLMSNFVEPAPVVLQ